MDELKFFNQSEIIFKKQNFLTETLADKYTGAMQKLSGSAYKFYMYLCLNANKERMLLSKVNTCASTGISSASYFKAKKELIEHGYLVPKENGIMLFEDDGFDG